MKGFDITNQEYWEFRKGIIDLPSRLELEIMFKLYHAKQSVSLNELTKAFPIPRTTMFYRLVSMRQRNLITLHKRKYILTKYQRDLATCYFTGVLKIGLMLHHLEEEMKQQ